MEHTFIISKVNLKNRKEIRNFKLEQLDIFHIVCHYRILFKSIPLMSLEQLKVINSSVNKVAKYKTVHLLKQHV